LQVGMTTIGGLCSRFVDLFYYQRKGARAGG
jgi:hypothetical protein